MLGVAVLFGQPYSVGHGAAERRNNRKLSREQKFEPIATITSIISQSQSATDYNHKYPDIQSRPLLPCASPRWRDIIIGRVYTDKETGHEVGLGRRCTPVGMPAMLWTISERPICQREGAISSAWLIEREMFCLVEYLWAGSHDKNSRSLSHHSWSGEDHFQP
jgi:hypothetical protein